MIKNLYLLYSDGGDYGEPYSMTNVVYGVLGIIVILALVIIIGKITGTWDDPKDK